VYGGRGGRSENVLEFAIFGIEERLAIRSMVSSYRGAHEMYLRKRGGMR
jgi:hypothetical protein